jgi:deazaflavin-dependent oxidoreductase (nitroreductase family)
MTFEKTPRGTRGSNLPSFAVPVVNLVNKLMIRRARRANGAQLGGLDLLALTTVGAKTGQKRQTVLGWFPDGDSAWLVVASAGGATTNPAWYHNVAAHPDQVQVEVGGKAFPVTATQLDGPERDAAWQRIIAAQPRYAGYEKKTDRLIPIIRLAASG